jgi:hypothetical protein
MASKLELTPISETEVKKIKGVPPAPVLETKWPKKESSAADARAALKTWQEKVPEPKPPENPPVKIKAVEPTRATLSKLAAVVNSEAAPAEILSQQFDDKTFLGTVYAAVVTQEYMRMQSEFRTRSASERTKSEALKQWPEVVGAFQKAFATAGLREVGEEQLSKYAKDLASQKDNLEAVTKIVNSALPVPGPGDGKPPTAVIGTFVVQTAKLINLIPNTNFIPNLCISPLKQGVFTRHFGHSFSLTVSLYVPCPTWTNPFRWCWKNFTIGSVSFSLDINVGYKVNCCGASAWGQAVAQACASIVGITVCASCVGTIVAVAGITKTPAGGNCNYGLGIVASLQCSFQGHTVFSASAPFGYTITGPCPPPGLNC